MIKKNIYLRDLPQVLRQNIRNRTVFIQATTMHGIEGKADKVLPHPENIRVTHRTAIQLADERARLAERQAKRDEPRILMQEVTISDHCIFI